MVPLRELLTPREEKSAPAKPASEEKRRTNEWAREMEKFLFKDVLVTTQDGAVIPGNLRALSYQTLTCVLND